MKVPFLSISFALDTHPYQREDKLRDNLQRLLDMSEFERPQSLLGFL
jgi:hypothetical protein